MRNISGWASSQLANDWGDGRRRRRSYQNAFFNPSRFPSGAECAEWSGVGSDIYQSAEKVFGFCEQDNLKSFADEDGLGAGVRGDARAINDTLKPPAGRTCHTVSW